MRSDPSGAGSRHSDTRDRTSDTTDGPASSSGPAHRQEAPHTSPIATPTFPEGQRTAESRQTTRNTMRSDPSGAAAGHSDTRDRTSDPIDGYTSSSGPVRR